MPWSGLITIEQHILDRQSMHPEATGEFTHLLYDIALAAKVVGREVNRAGLVNILGYTGKDNIQGEAVRKLDVFANESIIRMNELTGRVCAMASEEVEDIIQGDPKGKYVLIFDPLDGSSNIDYNVSIGTIFAIYRRKSAKGPCTLEDCLQPGRDLVAAGYIVYGSSTMLIYSTGNGVYGFTLDPSVGEFLLSHPLVVSPPPRYYSVNHAYYGRWTRGIQEYVRWLREGEDAPKLSERYIGSMVADFHRNLLAGGVFLYPYEAKKKQGKLRLLYEAAPLGYLAEKAGGYASNGRQNILDIQPTGLHQRVPVFIGDRKLVLKAEEFIKKYDISDAE
ncbi:MAG: class 1 fructose-bisphosphatase [Anaerolineales bacterium]|nr:class 1 fructose-bisphosphatase [Anaerolineales bacterium]